MVKLTNDNLHIYSLASNGGNVSKFLCVVGTGDYESTIKQILANQEKAEKCFVYEQKYNANEILVKDLEKENGRLKVKAIRYDNLQDRYGLWNEKHFGELCGLYFDDESLEDQS